MRTLGTLVILAGQSWGIGISCGRHIRLTSVTGVFVDICVCGIGRVVKHGAEQTIDAYSKEHSVRILFTKGFEHVGELRIEADDAVLPELGLALSSSLRAAIERWNIANKEIPSATLVKLFLNHQLPEWGLFILNDIPYRIAIGICRRLRILVLDNWCPPG